MITKHLGQLYKEKTVPEFIKAFGKKSVMGVPRIEKVIVNVGIGRLKDEKEREEVRRFLELITGQKPQPRPARIAIASFKTRKGALVGYRVTLRGKRMRDFLERLINFSIPRTRDFRGVFSLQVSVVTNAHSHEHGEFLFRSLGFPLVKK